MLQATYPVVLLIIASRPPIAFRRVRPYTMIENRHWR